jgi:hypothetical protein
VDEMFRMLGREHEADLEREAAKRRSAAQVGPARAAEANGRKQRSQRAIHLLFARVEAFLRSRLSPAASYANRGVATPHTDREGSKP